jgi:hypothetical protein
MEMPQEVPFMSQNENLSLAYQHLFKDDLIWHKLYCFLVVRVRYWVYSAQLSLWHGNEEEIAGDIVQDAIIGTWTYALEYSQWTCETETVFPNLLMRMSAALAYQHYRTREHYDSRFVSTRLRHGRAQRYVAVNELVNWQETAIASAIQEWYCECLVRTIMEIPRIPRRALLVQLANRMRLNSRSPQLLLSAFRKRDIRLEDYQHSLPRSPREWNKHRALLQFAYRQLIKEQRRENHELLSSSQDLFSQAFEKSEDRESDLVLAGLMEHLEVTAPQPRPDLAFRQKLRDELLDIMVEHQVSRMMTVHPVQAVKGFPSSSRSADTGNENRNEEQPSPDLFKAGSPDHAHTDAVEFRVFSAYLEAKAPLAAIDPVFRETLCAKLKTIPLTYEVQTDKAVESVLKETEQRLEQLSRESCSLPGEADDAEPGQVSLAQLQRNIAQCLSEQIALDQSFSLPRS